MRVSLLPAFLGACALLPAQGVYTNANKPGDPTCSMLEVTTDPNVARYQLNSANGAIEAWHQEGHVFYPKAGRKDVSAFTAYDQKGHGTSVASLKGKIVVVELWAGSCDPSARMLMELAGLYDRRSKFNFEILAVNFEANHITENGHIGGWMAVNNFKMRNRDIFRQHDLPFYVPGVGKEGASNFMNTVYSLPLLCMIDPDGKLASMDIGYEPQIVAKRLSQLVRESQQPAPAQAQPPAAVIAKPESAHE